MVKNFRNGQNSKGQIYSKRIVQVMNNIHIIFDKSSEYDRNSGELKLLLNHKSDIGKTGYNFIDGTQISILNLLAPHHYNKKITTEKEKKQFKIIKDLKTVDNPS